MSFIHRETIRQPFLRYLLALIVCIIFYFPIAGMLMNAIDGIVKGGTDMNDLMNGLLPIALRTFCGIAGLLISIKLILRKPVSEMIHAGGKGHFRTFIIVCVLWLALMFGKDYAYMLITGDGLHINPYMKSHINIIAISTLFALMFVPIHALCEEIMYRSIPMKGFAHAINRRWFIIIISSILFALNHGGQYGWFWIPLSILLALIVIASDNIIYTWAIHTGTNLSNALLISNPIEGGDQATTFFIANKAMPIETSMQLDLAALFVFTVLLFITKKWKFNKDIILGKAIQ
jgi:membrane protease YdiL (CAAX protease family)